MPVTEIDEICATRYSGVELRRSLSGLITHMSWSMLSAVAATRHSATTSWSREINTDGWPLASIQVSAVPGQNLGAKAVRNFATTDLPWTGLRAAPRIPL